MKTLKTTKKDDALRTFTLNACTFFLSTGATLTFGNPVNRIVPVSMHCVPLSPSLYQQRLIGVRSGLNRSVLATMYVLVCHKMGSFHEFY